MNITGINHTQFTRVLEQNTKQFMQTHRLTLLFFAVVGVSLYILNKLSNVSLEDTKSRVNTASETIKQEFYHTTDGSKIVLDSAELIEVNTELISFEEPKKNNFLSQETTEFFVVEQDCLEAANDWVDRDRKVVVINFANGTSPGGGFLRGAKAQEEDICLRSGLGKFMKKQGDNIKESFYESEGLKDKLLYTSDVQVFRKSEKDNFDFLDKPFRVGIITIAAQIRPEITLKNGKTDFAEPEDRESCRKKIYNQLLTAYLKNYDTVILGAFGCGAFKNPPDAVAELYKEVLANYFPGVFKNIVFAILKATPSEHNPKGNIVPFENEFSDQK